MGPPSSSSTSQRRRKHNKKGREGAGDESQLNDNSTTGSTSISSIPTTSTHTTGATAEHHGSSSSSSFANSSWLHQHHQHIPQDQLDNYHGPLHRPYSRILAELAHEIFPPLQQQEYQQNQQDVTAMPMAGVNTSPKSKSSISVSTTGGVVSNTNNNSANRPGNPNPIALLIREYLYEQRRKVLAKRKMQHQNQQEMVRDVNSLSSSNIVDLEGGIMTTTSVTISNHKKKRKKKKKKSIQAISLEQQQEQDISITTSLISSEESTKTTDCQNVDNGKKNQDPNIVHDEDNSDDDNHDMNKNIISNNNDISLNTLTSLQDENMKNGINHVQQDEMSLFHQHHQQQHHPYESKAQRRRRRLLDRYLDYRLLMEEEEVERQRVQQQLEQQQKQQGHDDDDDDNTNMQSMEKRNGRRIIQSTIATVTAEQSLRLFLQDLNHQYHSDGTMSSSNNNNNNIDAARITMKTSSASAMSSTLLVPGHSNTNNNSDTSNRYCDITMNQFQEELIRISCHACRQSVWDHVQYRTKVPLQVNLTDDEHHHHATTTMGNDVSSTNSLSSQWPMAQTTDAFVTAASNSDAFDYVAMEEGIISNGHDHANDERSNMINHSTGSNDDMMSLEQRLGPWYFRPIPAASTSSTKDIWRLTCRVVGTSTSNQQQMETMNNSNKNETIVGGPSSELWTIDRLINLFQDLVILEGISPDELLFASTRLGLNPDVVDSIRDSMMSRNRIVAEEFNRMANDFLHQAEKFSETKNHAADGNIEMRSFPIMRGVDEFCGEIMGRLLRIMLDMTRSLQTILKFQTVVGDMSYNGHATITCRKDIIDDNEWALTAMHDLWKYYGYGMQRMIDETAIYERQSFELANSQGVIVEAYCSATIRDIYRRLIQRKQQIVFETMEHIRKILLDRPISIDPLGGEGWTINLLQRVTVEEYFGQIAINATNKGKLICSSSRSALDHAFEDVLYASREWIETVHDASIHKIKETHLQRYNKMLQLLHNVEDNAKASCTTNGSGGKSFLVAFQRHIQSLQESKTNEPLQMLRSRIGTEVTGAVIPWIMHKLDHPYVPNGNDKVAPPVMPYSLRRAIVLEAKGRSESCFGGNGRARFVSILTGLLCHWLSDRYRDWQARLAEEELLNTIDNNKEMDSTPKSSKKGKKKKSKKSTGGTAGSVPEGSAETVKAVTDSQTDLPERMLAQSSLSGSVDYENDLRTDDLTSLSDLAGIEKLAEGNTTIVNLSVPNYNPSDDDAAEGKVEPKKIEEIMSESEAVNDCNGCDLQQNQFIEPFVSPVWVPATATDLDKSANVDDCVKVGVYGPSDEFESAEVFLVGRLVAILNLPPGSVRDLSLKKS